MKHTKEYGTPNEFKATLPKEALPLVGLILAGQIVVYVGEDGLYHAYQNGNPIDIGTLNPFILNQSKLNSTDYLIA